MNVFISYAAADKAVAEKIAAELQAQGVTVTHPMSDPAPGDNWALRVGKALEDANTIVVLLSPQAAESKHVQNEIEYALTSPRFKDRVVPVMVKKTARVPWILNEFNVLLARNDPAAVGRKIAERLRTRKTLRSAELAGT